ncbi:MAG: DUF6398 domain-containing protein, partial [Acidimicrobiales bacterium]
CDELLDVEYRTACRRLLARAAAGDPGAFRRGARVDNSSAGILWAVGTANSLFSPSLGALRVKDIAAFFGVNQGGINQRGRTLVRAAGIAHYSGLGSPDYLAAAARRRLIERRDRLDHLRRSF